MGEIVRRSLVHFAAARLGAPRGPGAQGGLQWGGDLCEMEKNRGPEPWSFFPAFPGVREASRSSPRASSASSFRQYSGLPARERAPCCRECASRGQACECRRCHALNGAHRERWACEEVGSRDGDSRQTHLQRRPAFHLGSLLATVWSLQAI